MVVTGTQMGLSEIAWVAKRARGPATSHSDDCRLVAISTRSVEIAPFLGHHRHLGRPEVCPTSGITGPASAPGALITVMPEVSLTPPRALATVYITQGQGDWIK